MNNEPNHAEVFFDLETQRDSDDVGGWSHIADMGLSVAVTYSTANRQFHHYGEHNVQALIEELKAADLVVGFNVIRFDYQVLSAYTDYPLRQLPTLDMLEHIYNYLGFRISLDELAYVNLGEAKSASGLQAVTWWKEGQLERLMEYCIHDVEITRDLYFLGQHRGFLLYHSRSQLRKVRVCW